VERGDEHREETGRERALEAVERDGVVRPAVGPHKKPHGLEARRNAARDDGQQDVHHWRFLRRFVARFLQSFDASAVNVVCSTFLSVHGRCVQAVITHGATAPSMLAAKLRQKEQRASTASAAADDGGRS